MRNPLRALPWRAGLATVAALSLAWLAIGSSSAQSDDDQPAKSADKPAAEGTDAPANGPIVGAKFDHTLHGDESKMPRVVVDSEQCTVCHASDDSGKLTLPGTAGKQQKLEMPICDRQRGRATESGRISHQPCLDGGCHVDDFLSVGQRAQAENKPRYRKAAAFCLGCHGGEQAPLASDSPTAGNLYCDNQSPDFHIEFNHLRHSQKTKCRDCHRVGEDFALQLDRPNHVECAACHSVKKNATPMSYCRNCHLAPAPSAYFKPRTYDAMVRACGSPEHRKRAQRKGKSLDQIPCFKHETKEHRVRGDEQLQCSQCHYMVASRKYWSRNTKYETLRDIKSARLIDNKRDRAHTKACGGDKSCHARDVDDSSGGSEKCTLCHPM